MRKSLLAIPMLCLGLLANASNDGTLPKKVAPKAATKSYTVLGKQNLPARKAANTPSSSRALSKVQIGGAGNLLTMFNSTQNQIFADDSNNTVVFIHRRDANAANNPGGNVGQYMYDISKDGGATWSTNNGPLNPSSVITSNGLNGRFPQAVMYRPTGQTNPDSAWLVYSGTWHNGGSGGNDIWEGECRGRARLTGSPSTFTQSFDFVNGANVAVASSMVQTTPGTFFNLHLDYHTLSSTQTEIRGLVIMKGEWNSTADSTKWTETLLPQTFESTTDGTNDFSNAGTPTIAFSPDGQTGYIAMVGDTLVGDADMLTRLLVWKTTNAGTSWTGPTVIDIDAMPGLGFFPIIDNTTGDTLNTGWFPIGDFDMVVDKNGNLHIGAILAIGDKDQDVFYPNAPMVVADITYNSSLPATCSWNGWTNSYLGDVNSYRGEYTSGGTSDPAAEYNRMQASRTADGSKVFFIWNDSDTTVTFNASEAGLRNSSPDVWGAGIDIDANKATLPKNFTAGDILFGGITATFGGGDFGGALFHDVSPVARVTSATTYNIPVVLTQIDYNAPAGVAKSADNPCNFYYCQNVDFAQADFTESIDNGGVKVALIGASTVYVQNGTSYVDSGATAESCVYGTLTPTVSNNVNTNVNGTYSVTWSATDSSGANGSAVRTVIVLSKPVAKIGYTQQNCSRILFVDSSNDANRTSLLWSFGDGSQSNVSPYVKTYASNGTKQIVMCISNPIGSDCDTVEITLTCVGIEDPAVANMINAYPVPAKEKVFVDLGNFANQEVKMTVTSILGNTVIPTATTKEGGIYVINTNALTNGVYFLTVSTPLGKSVKQLIIQK